MTRVPLNQLQRAWDQAVPAPGQAAPGVMRFLVDGVAPQGSGPVDPVMPVRVRTYMQTSIHLPRCEEVATVWVGDSHVFRVSNPAPDLVLINPREEAADSNLTVVTRSGRVYPFYLRAEGVNSRWLPDLAVHLVHEGDDGEAGCARQGRAFGGLGEDYLEERGVDLAKLELSTEDFAVYVARPEDADIAPVAVATDGRTMLLDFGPRADTMRWPSVSVLEEGVDQPVNARPIGRKGRILQVMAVGDLTLKSGQKVVCIRHTGHVATPRGVIVDSDLGRGG